MKKLSDTEIESLIRKAFQAREKAYAPYSGFCVGAALLTSKGDVYQGCNIENASYGATNCAERTAFFSAVFHGERSFQAICIVGGLDENDKAGIYNVADYAFPCGVCRQVMQEFCRQDFQIIVAKSPEDYKIVTLGELLPYGFGGEHLI